jgi:hypothetical protein
MAFRNTHRGFCVQAVLSGAHRRTHCYASYASMRRMRTMRPSSNASAIHRGYRVPAVLP